MKLHQYENYDEYVKEQTQANVAKLKNVWVRENAIQKVVSYKPFASSILCHGTRNGRELEYFKKFLPHAEIVWTEISHTATQFKNTVQHDFHEVREDFVGKFDIVYSNSFDHAYDPSKAILAWKDQLTTDGVLVIELMTGVENISRPVDPLEINYEEFKELAEKNGLRVLEKNIMHRQMSGAKNSIMVALKKWKD